MTTMADPKLCALLDEYANCVMGMRKGPTNDHIVAARLALEHYVASVRDGALGWRPIESVPENDDVLVWHNGATALGRKFTRCDGVIWTVNRTSQHQAIWASTGFVPPTHWQPLPRPPEQP